MGARADYVQSLLAEGKIKDPVVGPNLIAFAQFLDDGYTFADLGAAVAYVNSIYSYFRDHDSYLNVYNLVMGKPYNPLPDNEGLAFITNEDYQYGLVDIRVYDAVYQGPFDDLSFAANGPPGSADLLRLAVNQALESRGATLLSVDVMETVTRRIWNLPLYSNYKARVFFHGSPLDALTLAAVLLILSGIMFVVLLWRVGSAYDAAQKTKQVEETTAAVNAIAKRATDPKTPPEEREKLLDILETALPEQLKALGIPKAREEDWLGGAKKLLVAGMVGIGAIMILPALIDSMKGRK